MKFVTFSEERPGTMGANFQDVDKTKGMLHMLDTPKSFVDKWSDFR